VIVDANPRRDEPMSAVVTATRISLLGFGLLAMMAAPVRGQESAYRPGVIAKADQVLAEVGLKRNGSGFTCRELGELQRAIQGLAKPRRSIRRLADAKTGTEDQLQRVVAELRMTDAQYAELNLRMAQPGIDVLTNNRLAGQINANQIKKKQLSELRESLKQTLTKQRQELADAESKYAEVVLAARQDLQRLRERLDRDLAQPQVAIAFKVHAASFKTPEQVDAETLLRPTDRKLRLIEQEIFRESIPLETSPQGALLVDVVINDQSVPMTLGTNTPIVLLPAELATRLQVTVSPDAAPMRLFQVDGSVLEAREVNLPKVRVGNFVAENVAAAVLLDPGVDAQPLLGASFLDNFRFEIDPAEKTLNLLRLGE
jgi:clan AA aspartic protease (TIGR02281 family)